MTQWVKGLATKPEELSSNPRHPSLPQTLIPLLPQAIVPSSTIPTLSSQTDQGFTPSG